MRLNEDNQSNQGPAMGKVGGIGLNLAAVKQKNEVCGKADF